MSGRAIKFGNALKELRIHLCQTSDASKGVREFVEKFYVPLKQANPKFPILIRECSGVQPRAWARYVWSSDLHHFGKQSYKTPTLNESPPNALWQFGHGKETSVSLTNMPAENVLREIEKLSTKN